MPKTAIAPAIVLSFPTLLSRIKLDAHADAAHPDLAPTSWIQIAITGDFEKSGKKFSITRDDLANMVENFTSGKFPTPPTEICVDYEHLTQEADISPGDTKAAAWFKDLELRADGDELWALVEWTPDGAVDVEKKRYKYFSPVFSKKFKDTAGQEIGTTLINGALTNTPFLQGMQPVSLKLSARRRQALHLELAVRSDNEKRTLLEQAIRNRFGSWKDDGYGYHYCDTWLVDTNDNAEAIYSKDGIRYIVDFTIGDGGDVTFSGEPKLAVINYQALSAAGGSSVMKISLKAANGQTVDVEQAVLEEIPFVKELKAKVPGEGQRVVNTAEDDALKSSVTALKTSVEALQTESATNKAEMLARDAEDAVSKLLTAGKLVPAQKDAFIALFKRDKAQFEAITKDMPVQVNLTGPRGVTATPTDGGDVIAEVNRLAAEAKAKPELKLTTDAEAIAHVLKGDRTLYDRYHAATTMKV